MQSQYARPKGNVIVDGLREGVGFLENHSHSLAERRHVHVGGVDIFSVEENLSVHARVRDGVVHSVEAAEEGGFSAAGRSYERGDLPRLYIHVDIFQRAEVAVVKIQVLNGENRGGIHEGYFTAKWKPLLPKSRKERFVFSRTGGEFRRMAFLRSRICSIRLCSALHDLAPRRMG